MKKYQKNNRETGSRPRPQRGEILTRRMNRRLRIILASVLLAMAVLVSIIAFKAAATNTEYSQKALSQMDYSSSTLVAKAGEIYDANMTPVAVSNRVYLLIIDPRVILETEKLRNGTLELTAQVMSECFDISKDEIIDSIMENQGKSYVRYKGKTIVSEEQKQLFDKIREEINNPKKEEKTENGSEDETAAPAAATQESDEEKTSRAIISGVWFETEYRRYYPYGDLASKIIGFTTEDTTEGIWGLELYYNEQLRGINGRKYGYINSDGNLEQQVVEPKDGQSMVGTFDMNLTRLISDTAKEWFAKTDEEGNLIRKAKGYSVIAMDPNSGAVKAMVTDSDYDLNNPKDLTAFYTDEEIQFFEDNQKAYDEYSASLQSESAETENNSLMVINPYSAYMADGEWDHDNFPTVDDILNQIWRNGIISNSFEPGSTGKIITYSAALEEGLLNDDTLFDDSTGYLQFGRTIIKCHNIDEGGCGVINGIQAVAESCNVAFMEMGAMLGPERFTKYQEMHNLGQKTGIDLPGEISCASLLYTPDKMGEVELATNSFGQCYNVTILQLAAAFCADINGGYYYRPYTIQSIIDESGNIVESHEKVLVRQVISEETSAKVREALAYTVTNGTAYGIQVGDAENGILMKGINFGAKTGTAQKLPRSENKYVISVISTAPIEAPEIVLYVVIDEYEEDGQELNDSAPAQFLSGEIWYRIKDYVGLYSEEDPGPADYDWTAETEADGMGQGEAIMNDAEGENEAVPVPPADGEPENIERIENPDDIINPEDALAVPIFTQ